MIDLWQFRWAKRSLLFTVSWLQGQLLGSMPFSLPHTATLHFDSWLNKTKTDLSDWCSSSSTLYSTVTSRHVTDWLPIRMTDQLIIMNLSGAWEKWSGLKNEGSRAVSGCDRLWWSKRLRSRTESKVNRNTSSSEQIFNFLHCINMCYIWCRSRDKNTKHIECGKLYYSVSEWRV